MGWLVNSEAPAINTVATKATEMPQNIEEVEGKVITNFDTLFDTLIRNYLVEKKPYSISPDENDLMINSLRDVIVSAYITGKIKTKNGKIMDKSNFFKGYLNGLKKVIDCLRERTGSFNPALLYQKIGLLITNIKMSNGKIKNITKKNIQTLCNEIYQQGLQGGARERRRKGVFITRKYRRVSKSNKTGTGKKSRRRI